MSGHDPVANAATLFDIPGSVLPDGPKHDLVMRALRGEDVYAYPRLTGGWILWIGTNNPADECRHDPELWAEDWLRTHG